MRFCGLLFGFIGYTVSDTFVERQGNPAPPAPDWPATETSRTTVQLELTVTHSHTVIQSDLKRGLGPSRVFEIRGARGAAPAPVPHGHGERSSTPRAPKY
eukprot:1180691-Prorocentrum_minimum.AAC.4